MMIEHKLLHTSARKSREVGKTAGAMASQYISVIKD